LVRVTDGLSLSFLASLKGLYPQIDSGWMPGIYTHYLSSNMNPTLIENSCMRTDLGNFVLVFHPDVLKDLPFSICNANMQGRCINPSMDDKKREELLLMDSPGNLRSKPNMKTVSDWVNFYLDPETTDPRVFNKIRKQRLNPKWRKINKLLNKVLGEKYTTKRWPFVRSHEVIFDHIPIQYIAHILTFDKRALKPLKAYFPTIPSSYIRRPYEYDDDDDTDEEEEPEKEENYYCRDYFFPILKNIYKNLN
jgi:hypothetical protein